MSSSVLCVFFCLIILIVTINAFHLNVNHKSSSMLSMKNSNGEIEKIVSSLSRNRILTKTAQLGLLSKLDKAGFKVSTAVPLLRLADEVDAIGYLVASSDKILPLAAKAIDLAPALLPVAGIVLKTPPATLYAAALASVTTAGAAIVLIPDDNIVEIALQTALTVPFAAIVPGACIVGAFVLSKIPK